MTDTVPPVSDVDLILWIMQFLRTIPVRLVVQKNPYLAVPLPFNSKRIHLYLVLAH